MFGRSIVTRSRSALRGVRRGAHHAPQGTSFEPAVIANRLELNPTAERVGAARARPVIETKAQRKHWKRNGDPLVKPGGLLGNFADAKHGCIGSTAQACAVPGGRCRSRAHACARASASRMSPSEKRLRAELNAAVSRDGGGAGGGDGECAGAVATLLGRTACGRRKSPPRGVSREAFAGAVDGGATRTMLGRRSVVAVGEAVLIICAGEKLRGLGAMSRNHQQLRSAGVNESDAAVNTKRSAS